MAYVNNLIPRNTKKEILSTGDYAIFSKEKSIITVNILDTDLTKVLERHPLEGVAILNLTAGCLYNLTQRLY